MNVKRISLFRILAGGFLVYTGIQLIQNVREYAPSNYMMMYIFAVAFILIGAFIALWAVRAMLKERKQAAEMATEGVDDQVVEEAPPQAIEEVEKDLSLAGRAAAVQRLANAEGNGSDIEAEERDQQEEAGDFNTADTEVMPDVSEIEEDKAE